MLTVSLMFSLYCVVKTVLLMRKTGLPSRQLKFFPKPVTFIFTFFPPQVLRIELRASTLSSIPSSRVRGQNLANSPSCPTELSLSQAQTCNSSASTSQRVVACATTSSFIFAAFITGLSQANHSYCLFVLFQFFNFIGSFLSKNGKITILKCCLDLVSSTDRICDHPGSPHAPGSGFVHLVPGDCLTALHKACLLLVSDLGAKWARRLSSRGVGQKLPHAVLGVRAGTERHVW